MKYLQATKYFRTAPCQYTFSAAASRGGFIPLFTAAAVIIRVDLDQQNLPVGSLT